MPQSNESPVDRLESDAGTYVARHDWTGGDRPSLCVTWLVSEALGAEPVQLRPLAEAVDADALDAMFTRPGGQRSTVDRVSFSYGGFDVTVLADGRVVASERDANGS